MQSSAGFTIFELMITVAVLGIALSLGVPSLQQFIMDNRLVSQLNQLSGALALARSEAVKQNVPVVVCVSSDGKACDTTGVNWDRGWIVFVDRNANMTIDGAGDGCAQGATADCVLAVQSAFPGGVTTLVPAAGVVKLIGYDGTGAARCDKDADGTFEDCASATSYFTLCDRRGAAHARALAVSRTGRSTIAETDPLGGALTCP